MRKQTLLKAVAGVMATAAVSGGVLVTSTGTSGASTATSATLQKGAVVYCECLVRSVGPTASSPDIPIFLKDPSGQFSDRWFVAKGNQAFMLQTALTAITTGRHVNVQLADTVAYSEIISFYVLDF
jgi:hypothetical protein